MKRRSQQHTTGSNELLESKLLIRETRLLEGAQDMCDFATSELLHVECTKCKFSNQCGRPYGPPTGIRLLNQEAGIGGNQ